MVLDRTSDLIDTSKEKKGQKKFKNLTTLQTNLYRQKK